MGMVSLLRARATMIVLTIGPPDMAVMSKGSPTVRKTAWGAACENSMLVFNNNNNNKQLLAFFVPVVVMVVKVMVVVVEVVEMVVVAKREDAGARERDAERVA